MPHIVMRLTPPLRRTPHDSGHFRVPERPFPGLCGAACASLCKVTRNRAAKRLLRLTRHRAVQVYLAHKKPPLGPYSRLVPRVLGGWAFSYGRGTPVKRLTRRRALQGYLAHKKRGTPVERLTRRRAARGPVPRSRRALRPRPAIEFQGVTGVPHLQENNPF